MKCEFCGANIDIESPVCPHCGMQKKQFEQHRSDMNRFRQDFSTYVMMSWRKTSALAKRLPISQCSAS